ncbi:hypothetical protein ABWI00_06065 [Algihabitans albus]|uniref:hypothetical protein n=1 Tax=Algihabitans albus TaxID=2164067 RepID=UPI0035CFC29F
MTDPANLPDLTSPPKTADSDQAASGTNDPDRERIESIAAQAEAEEAIGGRREAGAGGAPVASDVIHFEAFLEAFKAGHFMAGSLIGSKALTSAPQDPACEPAARAIYDTCLEVEYFRFLIRPEGKWMQRALAVGAFALPTAMGVAAELRQKRHDTRAKGARDVSPPKADKPKTAPENDRRAYDG